MLSPLNVPWWTLRSMQIEIVLSLMRLSGLVLLLLLSDRVTDVLRRICVSLVMRVSCLIALMLILCPSLRMRVIMWWLLRCLGRWLVGI